MDKLKLLQLLFFATATTAFISCATTTKGQMDVITVDNLMQNADDYINDTITVRGFCTSVCNNGGDHMTIMGEDSTAVIEVRANRELFSFDTKALYSNVSITGILTENRVSEEFLNDWEFRLDQSLEGGGGNPTAVAQLKEQILMIRTAIAERIESEGKNYWSQYKIASLEYEIESDLKNNK